MHLQLTERAHQVMHAHISSKIYVYVRAGGGVGAEAAGREHPAGTIYMRAVGGAHPEPVYIRVGHILNPYVYEQAEELDADDSVYTSRLRKRTP